MSRLQQQTFTTSSIAGGTQGTFDVGITGGPSIVNILMIEVVPSVTGDGNTTSVELFHSSSRSTSVRYYNAQSFPGNLYDPMDNSSGIPALSSWGTPIAADDTDGSGQWHGRVTNSGIVAKTYTITIWYEEIQQTNSAGQVTFRSGAVFNGTVNLSGGSTPGKLSSQSTSVTTSALAILPTTGFGGVAIIAGDNGSGKQFVDVVAFGGSTVTVVCSNTVAGSPDTRTYTSVSNQLKLAMSASSYTISASMLGN